MVPHAGLVNCCRGIAICIQGAVPALVFDPNVLTCLCVFSSGGISCYVILVVARPHAELSICPAECHRFSMANFQAHHVSR